MSRDSFVFYRDWADALKSYPLELKSELFDCIVDFALNEAEHSEMTEAARLIFSAFKPRILRDMQRYQSSCERNKRNGLKGGRPVKESDSVLGSKNPENPVSYEKPKKPSGLSGLSETQKTQSVLKNPVGYQHAKNPENPDMICSDMICSDMKCNDYITIEEDKSSLSMSDTPLTPTNSQISYKELLDYINNSFAHTAIPQVRSLSDSRKRAIKARITQSGLSAFYEVIDKAAKSKFLNGGNGRNWVANIDWIIKPSNFAKILDGNFDERITPETNAAPSLIRREKAGEELIRQASYRIQNLIENNGTH